MGVPWTRPSEGVRRTLEGLQSPGPGGPSGGQLKGSRRAEGTLGGPPGEFGEVSTFEMVPIIAILKSISVTVAGRLWLWLDTLRFHGLMCG